METAITIQGEEYFLIRNYKENEKYRHGLNRLTRKTYGFDFEKWYHAGYWKERYIPYSLLHKEQVVANVSVSRMDYLLDGERKHCLQIGTVMTDEAYRGKGLSRALMEEILKEYEGQQELIYLYANDSVLNFYPKYGFTRSQEYIHSGQFRKTGSLHPYRKLDMNSKEDVELLNRLVTNTRPVSRITMIDNPGLAMFYLTQFLMENIYYFEELDLAAVAEFDEGNMLLIDVFSREDFKLEEIICSLMEQGSMKVSLGFTPPDVSGYDCNPLVEDNSAFFVKGKAAADFPGKGRFPLLSHA